MTDDRRDSSLLSGLTAGTIEYVLETRLGLHGYFMSGQVRPVTSATRFCGRARTLRRLPTRAFPLDSELRAELERSRQ